jgi:hypothetical protein
MFRAVRKNSFPLWSRFNQSYIAAILKKIAFQALVIAPDYIDLRKSETRRYPIRHDSLKAPLEKGSPPRNSA